MLSSDKSLKAQLNRRIKALEKQLDSEMTDLLANSYKESYYHTRYEVQRVSRYHAFNRLDDQNLSTLLSTPWAPDGKNYSERIWGNTQTLANHLQRELTVAFVRGEPLQKTIQRMTKVSGASQSAVKRLVLTESAYFATTGSANAYKAEGVDEYEIIATLDSKTSEICRHMDGKHFPMDEISPGVNAPPFHCYCRSAIMPYFPGVEAFDPDTRAARDPLTGKTVKVVDVPYSEWKEQYIKKPKGQKLHKVIDTEKKWADDEKIQRIIDEYEAREKEKDKLLQLVKEKYYTKVAEGYGISPDDYAYIRDEYNKLVELEPAITADMKDIAATQGVSLAGLDFRLKGVESLLRKVSTDAGAENISMRVAFDKLKDVIRYTAVLSESKFVAQYEAFRKELDDRGYKVIKVKNTWKKDSMYKGINTNLEKDGLKFEMQYHTEKSLDVKEVIHKPYEEYRQPGLSKERKEELEKIMIDFSSAIPDPKGVEWIR